MCIPVTWWAGGCMCQFGCYHARWWWICYHARWWWCVGVSRNAGDCVCLSGQRSSNSHLEDYTLQSSFLSCIMSPSLRNHYWITPQSTNVLGSLTLQNINPFPISLFPLQLKFLKDCYTYTSISSPPISSSICFFPDQSAEVHSACSSQCQISRPFFWI